MSWIFSIPPIIALIVYGNVQVAKNQHWFTGLLFVWILFCAVVLSPFRYAFLQLIIVTTYPYQSFYAFFTACALSVYIIPFVMSILYGIGFGLPALGLGAIVGFKDSISKTRLFLAAIAAPFLFIISSYLFYLVLPYAAYSTHWLRAEDVIRATNGPAEYVYKYLVEPWTPQAFPKFAHDMGLENLTSKERLRAHVATIYLGKKQFAYYVYKAYPEYADRERLGIKLDDTDKTPQEWPELTNEEMSKIYSITTKMIAGEPLGEADLEDVRRLQKEYMERTGIVRTEEEKAEEAKAATEYFNIIYQYNSEMDMCLLKSFDSKLPYISDRFQSLRKKMEASEIAIKPKLDADIQLIECTANREMWTDESGQKHNPLSREEILKRFENTKILEDNLRKYMDAIINYNEQSSKAEQETNIDKSDSLPKDYKGELYPHFSYEGLEYVGEFYQNYAYTNVDNAVGLADNHYVTTVFVAREDFGGLVYDHNSHKFAVMDINEPKTDAELEFHAPSEDSLFIKMWNKAKSSEWEEKDIKIGSENRKWIYADVIAQKEEINSYYFNSEITYHEELGKSSVAVLVMNEKRYTFYFDPDNNTFAPVASDFFWVPLEEMKYQEMKEGGIGFEVWNFIKDRIE